MTRILAWGLIGAGVISLLLPILVYGFYHARMDGSGVEQLNRQLAVSEGRNPNIPPGMYRLRHWLAGSMAFGLLLVVGAIATLGRHRWGHTVLGLAVLLPVVPLLKLAGTFTAFSWRAGTGAAAGTTDLEQAGRVVWGGALASGSALLVAMLLASTVAFIALARYFFRSSP